MPDPVARTVDNRLFIICGLAWGAGLIHVEAAIAHRSESVLYTVLFTLLAAAQFLWGAAVYRFGGRRGLLLAGAVVSLGVVGVWVASRTTGLPIGPQPGSAEQVGPIDSLATGDEIGLAVLVAVRLYGVRASRALRVLGGVATAASVWLIMLSSMSIVVASHAH